MMNELTTKQTSSDLCSELMSGSSLLELAQGWLKQGNTVVALELLKSAISSPEAENDIILRASIIKETGRAYMMQSDWDAAERFYLDAQVIFLMMEQYKGASECARNRANMNFQKGNYKESADLCEQALKWASKVGDHALRASILNTLAAIKSTSGELREAISIFKLCLADFESAGNRIRQGYVLLNIGLTETELGEYAQAINSLNRSLAIALDEKDQSLVEICYQNIAKSYLSQKEVNLAKSVIDTARRILPGLNSHALEAELNLIDCQIMRTMGNIEAAQRLIETTYKMAIANNMTALEADILYEQGLIFKDKGEFDLAVSKLDAAVNQYKHIGVERGFKNAIRTLKFLKRRRDA
jgi:tetratricopeptide (TPR) repeat protein